MPLRELRLLFMLRVAGSQMMLVDFWVPRPRQAEFMGLLEEEEAHLDLAGMIILPRERINQVCKGLQES